LAIGGDSVGSHQFAEVEEGKEQRAYRRFLRAKILKSRPRSSNLCVACCGPWRSGAGPGGHSSLDQHRAGRLRRIFLERPYKVVLPFMIQFGAPGCGQQADLTAFTLWRRQLLVRVESGHLARSPTGSPARRRLPECFPRYGTTARSSRGSSRLGRAAHRLRRPERA